MNTTTQTQQPEEESDWTTFMTNCVRCGVPVQVTTLKAAVELFERNGKSYVARCKDCDDLTLLEEEWQAEKEAAEEEDWLDESVQKVGVKPIYAIRKPYFPYVFDWLMEHRNENILLSGDTGTGKSTSAGCLVRELLREGHTVGMYYLSELLDDWRDVRKDDNPNAIKGMFHTLYADDCIVIDECAGKTVNSDSTREFMFRFLEDINSGVCRSRVFLLGNFYKGSVADMFGDESPSMRRIKENFVCGRIDPKNQRIQVFFKRGAA